MLLNIATKKVITSQIFINDALRKGESALVHLFVSGRGRVWVIKVQESKM